MHHEDTIPSGYCQCGCGERTKSRGARYLIGHHRRFAIYWTVDAATGCWEWQGYRNAGGYGRIRRDGRLIMATRWVWEQMRGPIPAGMQLDHLCRNHACVNPSHLEPVTAAVNTRRGDLTKLTSEDVATIRAQAGHASYSQLARRFGVSKRQIGRILLGESW